MARLLRPGPRRVVRAAPAVRLVEGVAERVEGSSSAMRSRIGPGQRPTAKRELERGKGRGDGDDETRGPGR